MSIDPERLNAFQTRMNGWVSSQGLLFQLRHGGAVQGGESALFAGFARLLVRGVLLLVVVGLVFWCYLAKRVEFGGFQDRLGEGISLALGADSAEVAGVGRKRGQLTVEKMLLEGGEESFFDNAQLRGVRTTMGLGDGIFKSWNGGRLFIKELRAKVKSGADTDEAAALAFQAVFRESPDYRFSAIEVEDATVMWGYSLMNRGSIRNARLEANKTDAGWKLVFTGGLFSQNWLRRLEIERIEVDVTRDGIVFEEMKLKQGSGTVSLRMEFVKGGARPILQGAGVISGMPVWNLVDPEFHEFIGGEFSGTFSVEGSTNSQEGIRTKVKVKLGEGDKIELRDRFSLFRAISAVDRFRSYKKVRFTTGQFEFHTGGGVMDVRNVWLSAPDLMRMEGAFMLRPPTDQEVAALLKVGARPTVGGQLLNEQSEEEEVADVSLKRAGAAQRGKDDREKPGAPIILGAGGAVGSLEDDALLREKRSPHMEGGIRLGLNKETFDRSPALERNYPVDPEEGLRWLDVPLDGDIFSVGVKQAEDLYLQSRESR